MGAAGFTQLLFWQCVASLISTKRHPQQQRIRRDQQWKEEEWLYGFCLQCCYIQPHKHLLQFSVVWRPPFPVPVNQHELTTSTSVPWRCYTSEAYKAWDVLLGSFVTSWICSWRNFGSPANLVYHSAFFFSISKEFLSMQFVPEPYIELYNSLHTFSWYMCCFLRSALTGVLFLYRIRMICNLLFVFTTVTFVCF